MSPREDLLGSTFVPALRITAAACLGIGVELVRLGTAKTLPIPELPDLKLTSEPRKPEARRGTCECLAGRVTSQPEVQKNLHQTEHYR
jgi:hypothetical protein